MGARIAGRTWSNAIIWVASAASLLPLLWLTDRRIDVKHPPGLGTWWLAFGFTAQGMFAARLIVQWLATEKERRSVVPTSFWWLSLLGGLMLLIYFWRRGDPVGIAGQLFGNVVYVRNLYFLYRERRHLAALEAAPADTAEALPTGGRPSHISTGANPRPVMARPSARGSRASPSARRRASRAG
jgi:lipid-A-disaccharide synthase-like uncharacterized protein